MHWSGCKLEILGDAMNWLGHPGKLPVEPPTDEENDEEVLKSVHHALIEVEVVEGKLVCPESGREFPITNGIPNMLLNEDEVWPRIPWRKMWYILEPTVCLPSTPL